MTRLLLAGQAWDDATNAFVGARVVRLEDAGSWTEVHDPSTTGAWHLQEFIDTNGIPRLVYIASNGDADRPHRGTLYRSIDEGSGWADITPWNGGNSEYCISVSKGAGDRLWAITDEREDPGTTTGGPSRIYYSDDWGSTWVLSYTIPETSVAGTRGWPLYNIAAHPTNANKVIVEGVEMIAWDVRMWVTSDGGASWSAAFDPAFPVNVDNVGGIFALQLDYATDGTLVYISRATAGSSTIYIFRSSDDGANWSTWHSTATTLASDGIHFLEGCAGVLWFISDEHVFRSPDFATTPPTEEAEAGIGPFSGDTSFMGIGCTDGSNLDLGVYVNTPGGTCCDPAALWQRPINLSSGWVEHPQWTRMNTDLAYRVYCWPRGLIGATAFPDRYELPCEDAAAAGDYLPQCIPIISWEISVDGQHSYFSRARAQGMGISNAGQDSAALLPNEEVWAPSGGGYGSESGTYNIRRELIVNDYGINQAAELDNLATAYVPLPDKTFKGITTIKFQIGGIPRAGSQAPTPNKIIQAGDRIIFSCGSAKNCGIMEGEWIVDKVSYEFPKGITTILVSRRPAAHVRPMVSGNIRNLGESMAAQGGVYESPWFSTSDTAFLANPTREGADALYDTFAFEHYMGVPPRTITMVAAKTKIFDWYDRDLVIAAQLLYVPRQFIDLSQVQGVGYNVVEWGKDKIVFHFLRYLFYDDIDGVWVRPQDRFLKVWLLP